jgi:flagellar biosynthetic protein FlhB
MAEEQQERTEQSSAKRREDFRKKGQVAQSKEVHTAALMTAFLLLWLSYGPLFWRQFSDLLTHLWQISGSFEVTPLSLQSLAVPVLAKVGLLLAPVFLLTLVVGFFSSFLQIGWLLTSKPLQPDFGKLNPIKGAARFFSKRSLVEMVKSLAKVLLVGVVAFRAVEGELEGAVYLVDMAPVETVRYVGRVAALVLAKSCGVLILLGLLDFLFVRHEMEQKMKMTKQEQKEEFKESEGDPHLKGRIRSLQQQMARKRMMAEVPKADVIITNPTHLSVAISYQRGKMDAPRIVAKGADHLAMRIREVAREHGVPRVENVPVARALYTVELGKEVPEEMFKAVAEILAYVYSLKRS